MINYDSQRFDGGSVQTPTAEVENDQMVEEGESEKESGALNSNLEPTDDMLERYGNFSIPGLEKELTQTISTFAKTPSTENLRLFLAVKRTLDRKMGELLAPYRGMNDEELQSALHEAINTFAIKNTAENQRVVNAIAQVIREKNRLRASNLSAD